MYHATGVFCFTSEIDKWPRYKMYVAYDIQMHIKNFSIKLLDNSFFVCVKSYIP